MSPICKIITIRQPWASLIVHGFKDVENRSWATSYRGLVLVHASQRPSGHSVAGVARQFGIDLPQLELPLGGIVGTTNIIDCVDAHSSPWFEGQFGFVLDGSRTLPFKPWKGALGLRSATAALVGSLGWLPESYQMRPAVT
jgi:ASCH domain